MMDSHAIGAGPRVTAHARLYTTNSALNEEQASGGTLGCAVRTLEPSLSVSSPHAGGAAGCVRTVVVGWGSLEPQQAGQRVADRVGEPQLLRLALRPVLKWVELRRCSGEAARRELAQLAAGPAALPD